MRIPNSKPSVAEMKPYIPPVEDRRNYLRLDFNENTVGCSPKIVEAIQKLTIEDFTLYPDKRLLREAIAKYEEVKENQVVITNGADEAIKVVVDTYISPNDRVILPIPCFDMFRIYTETAAAKIERILYNKNLSFPTKQILDLDPSDVRMIIIASPNNPTGTGITKEEVSSICAKFYKSLIVLDEAYSDFAGTSAKLMLKFCPNLLIIHTFSKALGLAALRLGYILAHSDIVIQLTKVLSPYSVNAIALLAGKIAIEDRVMVDNYSKMIRENREKLRDDLNSVGFYVPASITNFILVNCGEKASEIAKILKESGIAVRDRSKYPLLEGFIRVTVGTEDQNKKFVNTLLKIVKDNKWMENIRKSSSEVKAWMEGKE